MPQPPRRTHHLRILAVATLVAAVAVPACRKQEKPNANRDAEKSQEKVMKEMDRIQALEGAGKKAAAEAKTNPTAPAVGAAPVPGSTPPASDPAPTPPTPEKPPEGKL